MRCRGVVLIDVVMMLAVLGIVLLAVMPSAHPGESMRLVAASTVVASDVEFAQSATLARPADPTIVRFDTEGGRYWLALASDPETPILRPDGVEAYEVEFGFGAHRDLWGIEVDVQGMDDQTLAFDAMGRLVVSSDGVIRLGNSTGELAVVVRATTGSVSVVEGSTVAPEDGFAPQGTPGSGWGESGEGSDGGSLPPPPGQNPPPPRTLSPGILG
jgi:hypothetical protein